MHDWGIVILTNQIKRDHKYWLRVLVENNRRFGLNYLGIHPHYLYPGYELGKTLEFIKSKKFNDFFTGLIHGTSVLPAQDKITPKSNDFNIEFELHALPYLIPKKVLKKNEQWRRVNNRGKRTIKHNFCVSNQDALEYLAEKTKELVLQLKQTAHKYHLWQDDGADVFCHCEECLRLSPSDQTLLMMNRMLESIKEIYDDAELSYLAYLKTMKVPKVVKPEEGIFLEFAPIKRSYSSSLEKRENMGNKNAEKDELKGETDLSDKLNDLIDFFGMDNSQVLEYWLDVSLFSRYIPFYRKKLPFQRDIIESDLEFYNKIGINRISSFGVFLDKYYRLIHGDPPITEFGRIINNLQQYHP